MDKLTVLNDALRNTGNSKLSALNDGSDEWVVADGAFGFAIEDLITRHHWPFARETDTLGSPVVAADNPSQRFDYAYLLPQDALHLQAVLDTAYDPPTPTDDYELIGRYICTNISTGIAVEYVVMPADEDWHPQAKAILTFYVEAGCLRGLNEDFAEAERREAKAEARLLEARPRTTAQNPAKDAYVSTIARARRTRRGGW